MEEPQVGGAAEFGVVLAQEHDAVALALEPGGRQAREVGETLTIAIAGVG